MSIATVAVIFKLLHASADIFGPVRTILAHNIRLKWRHHMLHEGHQELWRMSGKGLGKRVPSYVIRLGRARMTVVDKNGELHSSI
ncbi:hypothetical protein B0H13DRAFT_938896 [Mycena leptocephala]|nr:hypothetical protein B0H13DRAFT_938896 [Mycena leptocephala]